MKKRIGTLKGRPIVDGDINLVKYPEIHYNNLKARTFKVEGEELKNEEIKKNTQGIYLKLLTIN